MIVFLRMSSSLSFRPLPLIPFLAADALLLLTAGLIAWQTPGAVTGGALLAVVVCVALGAILAVLPFVLNDAREREAALAERQRELVELVNTSTASASRWGTQWASAATGLEDAAQLASRSIATAERLPVVFQEKAEALAERLAAVEREALARVEKTAQQEAVMGARAEQMNATVAEFQRTLAEFGRVEAGLKEQRAAIAAVLAEAPAAVQQVRAAREELDGRVTEIPALADAQAAMITRVADEAEARLGATVEALSKRLAEAEALIGDVVAKLEQVAALPEPRVVAAEVAPAPVAQPVVEKPKVVVNSETIMDPFLIPDDGYASLAEAMDARSV
jgi:hypothetical protein